MTTTKHNTDPNQPDQDDNPDASNDNHKPPKGQGVAATLKGSTALTALDALGTMLNKVDTTSGVGGSSMPMLQFKKDSDGTWMYGQRRTIVEDNSRWAANPTTFQRGYICFSGENNKVLGERLLPVSQPMPDITEMPDKGFKWNEQWTVNMKCIDGTDAGTEVVYKPTTVGGIQAVKDLIRTVRDRYNSGQHGGKVVPIMTLEKDSYLNPPYGRVWIPILAIVGWASMEGPEPEPEPAPVPASPSTAESTPQPRRRRVG